MDKEIKELEALKESALKMYQEAYIDYETYLTIISRIDTDIKLTPKVDPASVPFPSPENKLRHKVNDEFVAGQAALDQWGDNWAGDAKKKFNDESNGKE